MSGISTSTVFIYFIYCFTLLYSTSAESCSNVLPFIWYSICASDWCQHKRNWCYSFPGTEWWAVPPSCICKKVIDSCWAQLWYHRIGDACSDVVYHTLSFSPVWSPGDHVYRSFCRTSYLRHIIREVCTMVVQSVCSEVNIVYHSRKTNTKQMLYHITHSHQIGHLSSFQPRRQVGTISSLIPGMDHIIYCPEVIQI